MNRTKAEGAVILAPIGRDASIAQDILNEAGLEAVVECDLQSLVRALRGGAGFAIVTEEALNGSDLRDLAAFLSAQEEWSDFPFIVLTVSGGGIERNPGAARLLATLGNVTFLERPFHPTSLVSLARAARRARLRQYEARSRLEEIREGQERMRVALGAGRLGAWSIDLKSNELSVTPEGMAHYGLLPDQPFTYRQLLSSIHLDDRDRMQAAARHSVETGDDFSIEYRCVWPDGSTHWIQVNGRLEHDVRGGAVRMVGVTQDVTARRQTENRRAALLTLGDRLRTLTSPDDMSFLAAEILGTTLDISRAGYGLIDRDAETITIERDWNQPGTQSLAGILHFRDYGTYIEELKRGQTVAIADARLDPRTAATAATLEAIDARAVLNMPLVDHGDLVALLYINHREAREWTAPELAFVRDVADRTQAAIDRQLAETSLAGLADSLERQVAERTRETEVAHEQLRQSQKMEAIGQLTGGLAHDFNNLLAGISGSLELMSSRIGQGRLDDLGRYIDMAQGATRRAAALTQRMLAFSRRQTLDPVPTEINQLVNALVDFLSRSVGPAIDLVAPDRESVWTTRLDRNQLENALLNLCINARDAMPDGGRIMISTANIEFPAGSTAEAEQLKPGRYVRLSVSDTGSGMAPETIERAFDPFFTTKPLGKGTGLGLSMIYGFVHQSGGHVRIHSTPGEGTTVTLFFPAIEGDADEEKIALTAPLAQDQGRKGTIMLVDDEPDVRSVMSDVLGDLGYQTVEAGDGVEGLALLNLPMAIDLMITDVGLPNGMNGRQLADAARVARPNLKVLFITGFAESAVIGDRQLEPGMRLLTKPFELDALVTRVQDMLAAAP